MEVKHELAGFCVGFSALSLKPARRASPGTRRWELGASQRGASRRQEAAAAARAGCGPPLSGRPALSFAGGTGATVPPPRARVQGEVPTWALLFRAPRREHWRREKRLEESGRGA